MTILDLENISLIFPGAEKPALHQINYSVNRGDFIIILGSNGSGKSTLLKILHGLHQASVGKIHFLGQEMQKKSANKFSQDVCVLTQNYTSSLFPSLTIYENYLLFKKHARLQVRCHQQEKLFLQHYLEDFNPNLVQKLDTSIHQLSGGEKQVFALAMCFLLPPKLLLLDEHTSALDPKTSQQVMQLTQKMLVKYQITCLLTTHDLDIALHYGNRILVLREGQIHRTINDTEIKNLSKEKLAAECY